MWLDYYMRKFLQFILLKPVLWATERFASRPQRGKIYAALSLLKQEISKGTLKKGVARQFNEADQYIIFSDQHKGARNGADDFMHAEVNYLAALGHYFDNGYYFISLGDAEELWENTLAKVKKHNAATFEAERLFIVQNKFYKIFGNHDLYWANDPLAWWQLRNIYGQDVSIFEGLVLETSINGKKFEIFLTHGHQGDASSDGNWFSKFFVARLWAPLQAYLRINPNTPAYDEYRKTEHNHIMYEWSASQKNLLLITGHTHQPVFGSLTHLERLYKKLLMARKKGDPLEIKMAEAEVKKKERQSKSVSIDYLSMLPTYFNSGCCCYRDGDITGIEITGNRIVLVKWGKNGREELEKMELVELWEKLN